jgi:very-short-patch-repair endonuclease
MAAVLACGPDAVLSHQSAAALWGIRRTSRATIDVTAPRRGSHSREGIVVHRVRSLDRRDWTRREGIPVTTVPRTLLDLAEVVRPRELERAFEEAERMRLLDVRAVEEVCCRSRGRRGLRPLGALLAEARGPPPATRSELERQFLDLCRESGLQLPLVNVEVAGYEVDAFWPEQRLVVELDSRTFHQTRAAFESDRIKDAALQLADCRVLRVTHRRLEREPAAVVATLRALGVPFARDS